MSQLLLSYYGDDLTGSTDAMEALNLAGVRTALFLKPATAAQIRAVSVTGPLQAIGLAGTSRSETPAWMDQHLPTALGWLAAQQAAVCHYKVCSTFDSAPHVGSIGRALDIGAQVFAQAVVPVVVGVPQLKRYTVFGHLFATLHGVTYRIDRHPVMSRHPVTPMDEADLCLHLGQQTQAPISVLDWQALASTDADARMEAAMASRDGRTRGLLLDVPDMPTQALVGQQLWRHRRSEGSLFVIGSSGVEYALVNAWRASGVLNHQPAATRRVPAVDKIAVVSGSCSATTAAQIRAAADMGFELIAADAALLSSRAHGDDEQYRLAALARSALAKGHSIIVYTAMGPEAVAQQPTDAEPHAIGRRLGRLLRDLVASTGLQRVVVAGGDTSSHALQELDVYALTVAMPLPQTPGSPLCVAHSDVPAFQGLQLALKGGQIGALDYFAAIRDGRA
ncbi:four-carbon acid sugar kinase family protein [Rhodoferax sp.]|uniref:four-carbon acid sugar kinase family protein n=1 Tax=Rhodoferax sp. TaxID=50421 RepID=UPI002ACE28C3|nr:four-carbon acid sugar kinase family protein [Rhodoferax sp.]MDZ7919528.1 four-carbon acid sugar kinase family protein [Rhodoferax sp.]